MARVIVACLVGVLFVAALAVVPPLLLFGGIGGILALALISKRPEFGLLGILAAISTIIREETLPLIPIGVGSLHLTDLVLLTLLGQILLGVVLMKRLSFVQTPLNVPLLAFYGWALLSTLIAVFSSAVEYQEGVRSVRTITYYLCFFVVVNLITDRRNLMTLLRGFHLLSALVAVGMIVQYFLGQEAIILPGRVENLWTDGVGYAGITRILPPGQSMILVSFVTLTVILILDVSESARVKKIVQLGVWGVLGVALLLTFTRAFWVAAILAFALLTLFLRTSDVRRTAKWGIALLAATSVLVAVTLYRSDTRSTPMVKAAWERLSTLWQPSRRVVTTLEWRETEYRYALPAIARHPFLGLGFGARYRPLDPRLDSKNFDGRYYIHNGHLWIMLKAGVVGYVLWMWLSLLYLIRSVRLWKTVSDSYLRATVLGFALTYAGVLVAAIVAPIFMQWHWTPVIGTMMGVNESLFSK